MACDGVSFNDYLVKLNDNTNDDLKRLTKLNFYNELIESIADDAFEGLEQLQELNLSSNHDIKTLKSNQFRGLHSLKKLYLGECNIETIEDDCFLALNQLESLYLHNNNIKHLNSNQFKGLSSLKKLVLELNFRLTNLN